MIVEEKTISSDRIYTGKVISLKVDTVEIENKGYQKREIVEHQGAVAIVALTDDDKVVLIKQFRKPIEQVIWEIPAGKLEIGENPKDCAIRELKEETGYSAKNIKLIHKFFTSAGFSNQKIYQESLFFNYYFETSKITDAKDTYTIYGNKFNYDNVKKLTTSYKYTFDVDNIVIKIQSYYDVIDSNATKIDKKTNTYYWVVNEDNASNFELKLTYSKDKKYTYNEKTEPNVIEKITGNIVEKVSFGKVNGTEFVKNNKIIPILLIGIVLTIILVIVFFIKKKIEKTNKL